MKKFFFYISVVFLILKIAVFNVGCANMLPPTGGLRDSLPPVLVKASPNDSSRNFNQNHITLTFDEFVQVDNARQNLIVSPLPKNEPVVESHLRTVTVRLKDTLQPNTTYTLNFGKTIKDVNEGNVLRDFTYMFSTGSTFDSLALSGKVILAETGRPDSALVVILHQHGDDSAVANEKPRYLTRLDSSGNFRFRNLPPGTFYIYALEDQGGNHRYLSEKQLFAFADSPVVVQELNKPILLYAYSEETTPNAPSRTARTPQVKTKNSKNAENRLRLQTNIAGGFLDLLSDLTITSDLPMRNLDTSRIHFSTDSSFTPVANYQITGDTTKKQLNLHCAWKENTRYNLIIEKDFAEDTLGRKLLKTDTISFKTKKISEYGTLRINFHGLDLSVNPVVEFVQSSKVVKAIPLTSSQLDQSIFLPGEYDLRILYDRNKNGKWDPGQFFGKHIQPEVVKPVTRKINIKADWENQFDIQL